MSRGKKAATAIGLIVMAGTFALVPLFFSKKNANNNLTTADRPLTGSQIMRGMYLNSGSKDVGIDPDWDPVTRTYRGKHSFNPTEADVEAFKAVRAKAKEGEVQQ